MEGCVAFFEAGRIRSPADSEAGKGSERDGISGRDRAECSVFQAMPENRQADFPVPYGISGQRTVLHFWDEIFDGFFCGQNRFRPDFFGFSGF